MAEELQIADYDFHLPPDRIAQWPLAERDAARLMLLPRAQGEPRHLLIRDLPTLLRPGDLLIFNQSKVVPARLLGVRVATGGRWEGLFLREAEAGLWEMFSQTRGRLREGETLAVGELRLTVAGRTDAGHLLVRPSEAGPPHALLQRFGQVPLPPYIRKGLASEADRDRYQTVYAKVPGSVAAPTAGLHFTPALLARLSEHEIATAFLTLHVGPGTFQPPTAEQVAAGRLHGEPWEVPQETEEAWHRCRQRGGRVIAVGTTSARTLESACDATGQLRAGSGTTHLFLRPPDAFRTLDGLLTNFHLPRSSLLMLVACLTGRERLLAAYREAISASYRFYSYGDAMLVL